MKNLKQLTLVSALIAAAGLGAQESVGTVTGTVKDASGAVVANATVRISGPNLLQPRDAVTDANGRYSFRLLLPGQTRVTFSKQGLVGGYQTVNVSAGTTLTVDFTMRAVGMATEEVEILGGNENPVIDKTETKVASTYTVKELQNVPVNGIGVYGALFLAPGVSGSTAYARIRGGTSGQTQYTINGIVMRDPEVGQGRQYEFVIDDLIQDVQVVQNPINAKYGFTSAGSVNITTKTGTNKFEGSFRLLLNNYSWNAITGIGSNTRWGVNEYNDWSVGPGGGGVGYDYPTLEPDTIERTYEITLSGPIWKDRVTFIYGGRFQPKDYGTFAYYNVLGANPDNWYTYLPGFQFGNPMLTGPNPNNPSDVQSRYAGYLWGRNPAAPTAVITKMTPNNFTFNQYKLFFQVTPNHQVDILYSDEGYTTFGNTVTTPDSSIEFSNSATRMMKGVNYRGILGASAVLSAQWGVRNTTVSFPKGPDDPIYVKMWQSTARSLLAQANNTGVYNTTGAGILTGGAPYYDAIREAESWSVDLNYIWDAHNIDVGLQNLNERSTTGGVGINNRRFYVPGMRYDGTYMVWNPYAADSPLNQPQSEEALAYYGYGPTAQASWKNAILGGYRVPFYNAMSGASDVWTPHDAQTTSVYVNDNWTLNDNLAVNVGVRLDKTLVNDVRGDMVDSMSFVPRLRVQYDLNGDNRHVFSASLTQAVGNLYRAAMGAFAANSKTSVTRTYNWDAGNTSQPRFVPKSEVQNTDNYGWYYSYGNSAVYNVVDPDLKPEKTTNLEFQYRRAFSQGGYFRASLIYNFLSTALFGELRDEEIRLDDPTGQVPKGLTGTATPSYQYTRYLYNRDDRGRHYAAVEMEWMMPLVTKPTWRVNWAGNWSIAKTTGNYIYEGSNQSGSTEGSTVRYYDQLVAVGMPRDMVDPWGESNVTPRHRMRSWVTLSHGERGGIVNDLTLVTQWTSGTRTDPTWDYTLPYGTFKVEAPASGPREGQHVNNGTMTGTGGLAGTMYPYGRAYWNDGNPFYYTDLTWNINIPIKGTLSAFVMLSIGNIFNNIQQGQGSTSWVGGNNGVRRVWRAPNEGEADYSPQKVDPRWGVNYSARTYGPYYGIYQGVATDRNFGGREFSHETSLNSMVQCGFRF